MGKLDANGQNDRKVILTKRIKNSPRAITICSSIEEAEIREDFWDKLLQDLH